MLNTNQVPLLQKIGKSSLSKQCTQLKHEYFEKTMRGLDTTVATSGSTLANTTDPVSFNVAAGGSGMIAVGNILLCESELMRVTAASAVSVTVARGFGSSTPASHADSTVISIVGDVSLTDAAPGASIAVGVTPLYNYVQAYNKSQVMTSTERAINHLVDNGWAKQLDEHLETMWRMWERSLLHGKYVAPTATVAGAMDGILTKVGHSYAKAGAAFQESFLKTALKDIWDSGNDRELWAYMGSFQKGVVDTLLDDQRQTSRTDRTAGTGVDRYEGTLNAVNFVVDRNIPDDTILIIDPSRIGFGPLVDHPMKVLQIADTSGFFHTVQIFGQYTCEIHNALAHAKITGLATS
jgi:hypothetical protein